MDDALHTNATRKSTASTGVKTETTDVFSKALNHPDAALIKALSAPMSSHISAMPMANTPTSHRYEC